MFANIDQYAQINCISIWQQTFGKCDLNFSMYNTLMNSKKRMESKQRQQKTLRKKYETLWNSIKELKQREVYQVNRWRLKTIKIAISDIYVCI